MDGVARRSRHAHNDKRRDNLYLPVQPALALEHRRLRWIRLIIISGVCLVLAMVFLQHLYLPVGQGASVNEVAGTPVVTVQFTSGTSVPSASNVAQPVSRQMPDQATQPSLTVVSDLGYVNVRSGPGVEYGQLATLASGTRVVVTGRSADGTWWQITFSGKTGWVFGQLTHFDGDLSQVPVVTSP